VTDVITDLRQQAEADPSRVSPDALVRALSIYPEEADAVGKVLATLDEAGEARHAVAAVADCLRDDDETVRAGAASALHDYLDKRSEPDTDLLKPLTRRLDDEYGVARRQAGAALRAMARKDPTVAVTATDRLPALLDGANPRQTKIGLDLVEMVVETDAEAAVDLLAPLLEMLDSLPEMEAGVIPVDGAGMGGGGPAYDQYTSSAEQSQRLRIRLAALAHEILVSRPSAVNDHLDAVCTVLETVDAGAVRAHLAEALGHVADGDPDTVASAVAPLGALLADDDQGVVVAAAWALGILAETHPQRVADVTAGHVESLEQLLSGDENAQTVSVGLLSYVCENRPEVVDGISEALVAQLAADSPNVRAMAAVGLGRAGVTDAAPELRNRAENDPDEDVRAAAADAVDRLDA
jgi:HEAT repeat protein